MDTKTILVIFALAVLVISLAPAGTAASPHGNQSMQDIQRLEQRNTTPAGAGIPGGTNQYWPTSLPMPSPAGQR